MVERDFTLIHKFCLNNTYIVLDINSGIVHNVSKMAWDALTAWEEAKGNEKEACKSLLRVYKYEDIEEVFAELKELEQEGMLFSHDPELDHYNPKKDGIIKALCLHVAHDCNMRCRYCFAGTGNFGGQRTLMDVETGKAALEFLFQASGVRKHVEVDYFGGEPLLNFQVVRELIEYGKKRAQELGKILKQTLTTNAVLLSEEIISYLNQEEISLVLSLDGRPPVNDFMRPLAGGQGSYDLILPRIKKVVKARGGSNYYVRGTFTRFNQDFARDVVHMVEQGFSEVSVEPVVALPEHNYALREEDLPELEKQYEELAQVWLEYWRKGTPFKFFHFNIDLDKGPCLPKRLSGCGAGHEYLAVSPEGDLYPCHQFVGKDEFKVGTVKQGLVNKEIGQMFKAAHVLNKPACRACWARFFCSGGCHANAYNFNSDLHQPYQLGCMLEKKRLECAIYIQVKVSEEKIG